MITDKKFISDNVKGPRKKIIITNALPNNTLKFPYSHRLPFTQSTSIRLSFQLMTRAEPIEMVIASIQSLLAIKAIDDEILIIDNNHTNTALYMPLERFCAGLDKALNVRFYHVDAVAGFKAGALNLALELMNPDCNYVVVVDSDYQALPQARTSIIAAIEQYPNHAILQFPQFYRDAGYDDIHSELNHYFNYHLYRRFNRERALSTGTYAVIRYDALLQLGGWSGASITEDAQMGVLMHRHGLRSQFILEVIANGLLPNSVVDLMNQRRRWIYGNMQVLSSYFSGSSLFFESSTVNKASERFAYIRAHFSQLSAWVNFTGIFILLHICMLFIILTALMINNSIDSSLLLSPLYMVYVAYAVFLLRRLWAYMHDYAPLSLQINSHQDSSNYKPSIRARIRAWLVHLNFWELGALSWLPVLWGRDKPFICTPKQQFVRSRRKLWLSNTVALPKLLLLLNVITVGMLAPFSPLYSPVLFGGAIAICLLKLWAAKVMFANYAYIQPSLEPSAFADIHSVVSAIDKQLTTVARTSTVARDSIPSTIKKASANKYRDKNSVNP